MASQTTYLTRRFTQVVLAGIALITLAAILLVGQTAARALARRADADLGAAASQIAVQLQRILQTRQQEASLMARVPAFEDGAMAASAANSALSPASLSAAELARRLDSATTRQGASALLGTLARVADRSSFSTVALIDRHGILVASTSPNVPRIDRDERWWQEAIVGVAFRSAPLVDTAGATARIQFAEPVLPQGASEPQGVLLAELPLASLGADLGLQSLPSERSLTLVDGNRRIVFSSGEPRAVGTLFTRDTLLSESTVPSLITAGGPGRSRRLAVEWIPALGWWVIMGEPTTGSGALRLGIDRALVWEGIAFLLIGLLAVGALQSWLRRRVMTPLRSVERVATSVAEGDLSALPVVDVASEHDEIGRLGTSIGAMVTALQQLVRSIAGAATEVAAAAEQISGATEEMSASTQEVAGTTSELTDRATAQASMVRSASDDAERILRIARELAAGAVEAAQRNAALARIAREHSLRLETSTQELLKLTEELDEGLSDSEAMTEGSVEIEKFVLRTRAIARQTHMLALNAAIEAVRGDTDGRGFGVVADEVRKLARETAEASVNANENISGGLTRIRHARDRYLRLAERGRAAREATRDAATGLQRVVSEAEATDEWTRRISASAEEVRHLIDGIAGRMKEVSAGTEEYAAMAEQIAAAAQELNAATEQIAASAQHLAHAAGRLTETVGGFRLEPLPRLRAGTGDDRVSTLPYDQV